jgi:hypothetical protein
MGRRPIFRHPFGAFNNCHHAVLLHHRVLAPISRSYPRPKGRLPTCYSPLRRFTQDIATSFSQDLHVLGTPPAFVLSQDQTLRCSFSNFKFEPWRLVSLLHIRYNCQVTKPCAIDSRHTHTFQRTFSPSATLWPDDKNAHVLWALRDFTIKEFRRLSTPPHHLRGLQYTKPFTESQ